MAQLSGTTDTSTANVVISTVGTTDWWHPIDNLANAQRKSGGGSLITWVTPTIGGVVIFYNGSFDASTMSWVGGTPNATGSDNGVLYFSANGGFHWTIPADTSVQTLDCFFGALAASGGTPVTFTATLSDGSAGPYTVSQPTDGDWNIHLTFQAASAGQTLTIELTSNGALGLVRGIGLSVASAAVDQPRPRRLRIEETPEESRPRRRFAPIVAAVVADRPARALRRPPDDVPEDLRPRRHSDAIAALDVPVTIPGLKLWLRGDGAAVSGGNVTGVADWSGNGNDVTNVGTVPYVASSINGKPGWSHSAGARLVNLVNNLFAAGSARTIFIVAKSVTEVGGPLLESERTSGVRATYFQGGSGYAGFVNGVYTNSVDGSRNATVPARTIGGITNIIEFSVAAAPAYLTARINGAVQSVTQVNPCDAETGAAGFAVGWWEAGGSGYIGDIDEVIVVDRDCSAAEKLVLRTYLADRYLVDLNPLVPRRRSRFVDADPEEPRARRRLAPIVPVVTPDSPPPRASKAIARRLADESREEPDPRARKPRYGLRGSIGVTTDTSAAAVDLTAIGTSDWKTFVGVTKPGDVIRKIAGGSQISDWTLYSGGTPLWTPGFEPNVVQWSDGNPTLSGSHSGILYLDGLFATGFTFTVPADTNARTLHLYLGALNLGSALLEVSLSDGSAADSYTAVSADGEWNAHIAYQAASPGARLTVSFYVSSVGPCQVHVRGLALAGPAYVPDSIPFVRRLWAALASWDVEELRPRPRRAPILAAVAPDSPPPRALTRQVDTTEDERASRRPRVPVAVSVADNPPPRTLRRREAEAEEITGRRNRKLVPQPAAVVNNPPPRAGRSNWRVALESFEPVELLRKVYRLVFPGIDYPPPVPPLQIVENDVVRTIADTTSTRSIVETDTVREVSPMKTRKVGDTADVFSGTLYSGGAPRSLAGSSVKLWMWDSRTHALKINGAVCLVEPSGTGTWSYQPIAADVDTAGEWEYDVEETLASGRLAVYPSSGYGKFVTEERVG